MKYARVLSRGSSPGHPWLPVLAGSVVMACATAGTAWMTQPSPESDGEWQGPADAPLPTLDSSRSHGSFASPRPRILGPPPREADLATPKSVSHPAGGRVLGRFRNTYYDFPNERDYQGPALELRSRQCKTQLEVPRPFFEALCVQGSGTLKSGETVSFARRDCECAELCPRTEQRICFDLLDRAQFPWGRGASGVPVTPLLSVAVDATVIPMGSSIYVPECDGLPRDLSESSTHDGCFLAQDRGLRVQGKQIDIFTGHVSLTKLWNKLVPTGQGVTVVLDSPHCARVNLAQKLTAEQSPTAAPPGLGAGVPIPPLPPP